MEYYSAIKKNKVLPFMVTWMDLVSIMLSEINHIEKEKHHMISFIRGIKKIKSMNKQNRKKLIDTENKVKPTEMGLGSGTVKKYKLAVTK